MTVSSRQTPGRLVTCVVGARPNFVKAVPVMHALLANRVGLRVVNTGQHYDRALAGSFIEQLDMPLSNLDLGIGSGSHAEQTAAVLIGIERDVIEHPPDAVIVAGDVNSTLGAALAAAKCGIPVVHIEAGLRSRDWSMPEEINRVVVDRISDLLLCHCDEAVENLIAEGADDGRISLVGNTMIDTLFRLLPAARRREPTIRLGVGDRGYILVTLHRPALVDDAERLRAVLEALAEAAHRLPVVFPLHPRTRAHLKDVAPEALGRLRITEPLDYLDFLALQASARLVVTDSGGIQEETSALGVPCITYRENTERAITVRLGTNRLVGLDPHALATAIADELERPPREVPPIPLWDGRAGERAADSILRLLTYGDREPDRALAA